LTSVILLQLAREAESLETALIMVQDDVADRLVAAPGSRAYGSITVAMALRFSIESVLRAPRGAFWPAPEVDSAVLRLTPHSARLDGDPGWIERVVRAGFAQRRKTLAKALAAGLDCPRPAIEGALSRLAIDPSRRAETLSPADFVRLAAELATMRTSEGSGA
jgi:16S rRNA (adenine1518-N6/adenine1519-N6)-dimethyltransferase